MSLCVYVFFGCAFVFVFVFGAYRAYIGGTSAPQGLYSKEQEPETKAIIEIEGQRRETDVCVCVCVCVCACVRACVSYPQAHSHMRGIHPESYGHVKPYAEIVVVQQ